MPETRPIEDLRNYNELSELCHRISEPLFLTKDGNADLALMSMETYERLFAPVDLKGSQE